MKYIITESQYKLLTEDRIDIIHTILNNVFNGIKEDCQDIDADSFPNDLSFQSCDECEAVDKITIKNHAWAQVTQHSAMYKKGTPQLVLTVDVDIDSAQRFEPHTLLFDIAHRMRDWFGVPVKIDIDKINHKGRNW